MFSKAIHKTKESHTKPELSHKMSFTEFEKNFPREFSDLSQTLAKHAAQYRTLENADMDPHKAHARLDETVCNNLKLRTVKILRKLAKQAEGLEGQGVQMDFYEREIGIKISPRFVKEILAFSKKQ